MSALAIAWVNVLRMLRDKTSLFFVFLLPVVLIVVLGLVYGGRTAPRLGVLASGSGPLGEELLGAIRGGEVGLEIRDFPDEAELRDAVEQGTVELGLVIPAGYDGLLRTGGTPHLAVLGQPTGALVLQRAVTTAVARQAAIITAARLAAGDGATFDASLERARAAQALTRGIAVRVSDVGERLFPANAGMFSLGAQSQLVLFMFLTSMTAAVQLILTRQLGVSRRMFGTPTSALAIVVGEALGRFGVVMIQGIFIVALSATVFGVGWGDPLAASLLVVAFGLVGTGFAMLLGTIARNPDQAGTLGVFLGMMLGFLGGAMVPLELFSGMMRTVAYLTPHAWAIDGLRALAFEGGGVAAIAPQLGILVVFGMAPLIVAGVLLRRSLAR